MKLLKTLYENHKLFSNITQLVTDYTDINFNDVDLTFLFSHGNIKCKDELNIDIIKAWYSNNRDNFKRIYYSLKETYAPLFDKNIEDTKIHGSKQSNLKSNNYINGVRESEITNGETENKNYSSTYESHNETPKLTSKNTSEEYKTTSKIKDLADEETNEKGETTITSYQNDVSLTLDNETISGHNVNVSRETHKGITGARTQQDLLESEIKLRVNFNWVQIFCDKFLKDLTLNIWGCSYDN